MVTDSPVWQNIIEMYAKIDEGGPIPECVNLTDEQISVLRHPSYKPIPSIQEQCFGIPVMRVETVEESTPFKLEVEKAERDGYKVVSFGGKHYAVKPQSLFNAALCSAALNTSRD